MLGAIGILGLLFDGLADGVCVADGERKIIYANGAALRLLGGNEHDLAGRRMCEAACKRLVTSDGRASNARCPSLARGVPSSGLRGKLDGRLEMRFRCEPLASPLLKHLGPGLRLLLLEEAGDEAEAEKQKEDWRNMLVHDMRSPLANVFGVLRLIEETHARCDPQEAMLLEVSLRSCRKVLQLLDQYLDVAKLEAGLMPVRAEAVQVEPLVSRCVAEYSAQLREKRLKIETRADRLLVARADPDLFSRVVQNLISNAVKFSPRGGLIGVVASRADGPHAELRVSDQGPGIDPAEQLHLFERFHQGHAATGGTGLGLAFCFQALQAMKGAISVSSMPGRGSEFVVRLPVARS